MDKKMANEIKVFIKIDEKWELFDTLFTKTLLNIENAKDKAEFDMACKKAWKFRHLIYNYEDGLSDRIRHLENKKESEIRTLDFQDYNGRYFKSPRRYSNIEGAMEYHFFQGFDDGCYKDYTIEDTCYINSSKIEDFRSYDDYTEITKEEFVAVAKEVMVKFMQLPDARPREKDALEVFLETEKVEEQDGNKDNED